MIKIEKGIALPARGRAIPAKYPWAEMAPGDSFFVPNFTVAPKSITGKTAMSVHAGKKIHPGSKWTMRTVTENGIKGVRVWRLS